MEASTETTETPDTPTAETSPAEGQDAVKMWQFSSYVHVGPGAETCEKGEDGTCTDPQHFHAWIRLPNKFQQASIREKALAAKARKARQLRDPETDSSVVLDEEMERMAEAARKSEEGKTAIVEELMAATAHRDHLTALREMSEEEEWKTIGDDLDRHRHLSSLPEDERDADEYGELVRHLEGYDKALEERIASIQKPERDGLMGLDVEALMEKVREGRVDAESTEDYMEVYSKWEWYIGTLKPVDLTKERPSERVFAHVDNLQAAAPEVISALETAYTSIELAAGTKGVLGNS